MPENKPAFNPNQPFDVVDKPNGTPTIDPASKPKFDPNKAFTKVGTEGSIKGVGVTSYTEPSPIDNPIEQKKFEPEFWNRLNDDEQILLHDNAASGKWTPEETKYAEDVMRGNTPTQKVISSNPISPISGYLQSKQYYLDPSNKGLPKPVIPGEKIPVDAKIASTFSKPGSEGVLNKFKDVGNALYNGVLELSKTPLNVLGGAESIIGAGMRKFGVDVPQEGVIAQTANEYNKVIDRFETPRSDAFEKPITTEYFKEVSDVFNRASYDFNADNIIGNVGNALSFIGNTVLTGGSMKAVGTASELLPAASNVAKAALAQKAKNIGSLSLVMYNDALKTAEEAGLSPAKAAIMATVSSVGSSAIFDGFGSLPAKAIQLFKESGIPKNIASSVIGAIEKDGGKITEEALAKAFETSLKDAKPVVNNFFTRLPKELAHNVGAMDASTLYTAYAEELFDTINGYKGEGDEGYGSKVFSKETFVKEVNSTIQGTAFGIVGAATKGVGKTELKEATIYNHVKNGDATILKNQLTSMYKNGDITAEDFKNTVVKIDAYSDYNALVSHKNLSDEDNKKIFELTWKSQDLNKQVNDLRANKQFESNPILQAEVKNLETARVDFVNQISDIMAGRKEEPKPTEEKKTTETKPTATPKATENAKSTPEENNWIVANLKDIGEQYGADAPFEELYAEGRRIYAKMKAKEEGSAPKVEVTDKVEGTEAISVPKEISGEQDGLAAESIVKKPAEGESVNPPLSEPENKLNENKKTSPILVSAKAKIDKPLPKKELTKIQQYKEHKKSILGSDPQTDKGFVLQHFLGGGKINEKDFMAMTGYKFADTLPYRRFLDRENKQSPLDVFFERAPEGMRKEGAMDESNFIIETLIGHKNKGEMVNALLKENEIKGDEQYIDPELLKAFKEEDKSNEDFNNLTKEEIDALGKEYDESIPTDEGGPQKPFNSAYELANMVREGKVSGTTIQLFVGQNKLINTAIEAVALAIEGGAKLAEAIKKGIEHIKKSEWYKNLDNNNKAKAEKEFKSHVENKFIGGKELEPNSPAEYKKSFENKKDKIKAFKTSARKVADRTNEMAASIFAPISTQLERIHPIFKKVVRDFQRTYENAVRVDNSKLNTYFEKTKKMQKESPEDYSAFDKARRNNDTETYNRLVKKYGLEKEEAQRATLMEDMYNRAKASGLELGHIEGYHPRLVKDSKGLFEYMKDNITKSDWEMLEEKFSMYEQYKGEPLTITDKAEIISSMLGGYGNGISFSETGQMKERSISHVTPEMEQFYYDSNTSLIRYVSSVNQRIEARRFFGKGEKDNLKAMDAQSLVGMKLMDLFKKGEITLDDMREAQPMIKSYFNDKVPNSIITNIKNIGFIDAMGSITSAITSISEIGWGLYVSGVAKTGKALKDAVMNKSNIKINDLIADHLVTEFGDTQSTQKITEKIFKYTGLTKMDRLGKESFINSYFDKIQKQAKGLDKMKPYEKKQFMDSISKLYDKEGVDQTIKDLKAGEKSELVMNMLYNKLLDFTPVAKSEMSQTYLDNPNARVFYSLKQYMLKQVDVYRNEVFSKLKSKNEGDRLEGAKRFAKMALSLSAVGMTTNMMNNLILGRETDLPDEVVNALLKLLNITPYTVGVAEKGGLGDVVAKQIEAAPIIAPFKLLGDVISGKGLKHVPIVGKVLYEQSKPKKKKNNKS